MTSKLILGTVSLTVVILLSACTGDKNEVGVHETKVVNESQGNSGMDHSSMNPTSTNEVPKGLKIAENPTYPIGSHVVIKADHMEGMKGANATIESALVTTVYMVDYTSTSGEEVKNHKWVTENELTAQ